MKGNNVLGRMIGRLLVSGLALAACVALLGFRDAPTRTIIMVWDGLRPDSITLEDTPNLYAMRESGVNFIDHHSTYPTFTMMNGQSFATGSWPGVADGNTHPAIGSGFYGNSFWAAPSDPKLSAGEGDFGSATFVPRDKEVVGAGRTLFVEPVFTEDHLILDQLNEYYRSEGDVGLILVSTLFQAAQAQGLKTATIGKAGAAFIQDFTQSDSIHRVFVDENSVRPAELVRDLIHANYPLPSNIQNDTQYAGSHDPTGVAGGLAKYVGSTQVTYAAGASTFPLNHFNDPIYCQECSAPLLLSSDPSDHTQGASEDSSNHYLMHVFKDFILANPKYRPDLALIWFRTPDSTEHAYGPGSPNARAALRSQDARLGELLETLRAQDLLKSTNLMVVSDHGHSSVSGPFKTFPLMALESDASKALPYSYSASPNPSGRTTDTGSRLLGVSEAIGSGYSFSGDFRIADALYYRGLDAYDGAGCLSSSMVGLVGGVAPPKGATLKRESKPGDFCQPVVGAQSKTQKTYMAVSAPETQKTQRAPRANFALASKSQTYSDRFVMSTNQGGSDYLYVPSHNGHTVAEVVRILQQRAEIGAIFVDGRYLLGGADAPNEPIAGVLPMRAIHLENPARQGRGQPDVVVSFNWDGTVISTTSTADQGKVVHVGPMVQAMAGITFESFSGRRGMHGGFGPTDVHNTLIAKGPAFKAGYVDVFPSGNVDVAPTVAYLLGTQMPQAQGRVLTEALNQASTSVIPSVVSSVLTPHDFGLPLEATGLRHESLTDWTGGTATSVRAGDPKDLSQGRYSIQLSVKDLKLGKETYRYFDYAQAIRH